MLVQGGRTRCRCRFRSRPFNSFGSVVMRSRLIRFQRLDPDPADARGIGADDDEAMAAHLNTVARFGQAAEQVEDQAANGFRVGLGQLQTRCLRQDIERARCLGLEDAVAHAR